MFMKWVYHISYLLNQKPWDPGKTPEIITETLQEVKPVAGYALDLGCGTGTHSIAMARDGWKVIGIDYIPSAISEAKEKAKKESLADRISFLVGDVTNLGTMDLPKFDFVLDVGCYHSLKEIDVQKYVIGLSKVLRSGGTFLLYSATHQGKGPWEYGKTPTEIHSEFKSDFEIVTSNEGDFWRIPGIWYCMVRI